MTSIEDFISQFDTKAALPQQIEQACKIVFHTVNQCNEIDPCDFQFGGDIKS